MRLTPNQQTMIQRHLRGVALSLDPAWPETRKRSTVQEEKSKVLRRLAGLGKATVSDGDVAAALEALLTPESDKKPHRPSADPESVLILVTGGRVWLGVCGGLAARLRLERWVLRALFVLAGCLTGPFAILVYLGLYAKMHFATPEDMRPELLLSRSLIRAGGAVLAVYLMHHAGLWAIKLIFYGNDQFLVRYGYDLSSFLANPDLGEWNWLCERAGGLRRWALFLIVPAAGLSGLALANAWDHTMKRTAQAIAALYGVMLCFGVASVLVGLILEVVEAFRG